jgi:hypothetical protein
MSSGKNITAASNREYVLIGEQPAQRRISMNRRSTFMMVCCYCAAMLLAGCAKSSDQQNAADANSAANSSSSMADSAKSAVKKAIEPKPLVVPADTVLTVELDQTISSKTTRSGERFSATVQAPVEVEGKVAIPKDARAYGVVNDAKAAGRFKGGAVLALTLSGVTVNGKDYELQTSAPTMTSKGKGKRTAVMVGGGAGGGAAIGAIAGGGKGAAIGALVGAAAGTGGAAFTGNRDITLGSESILHFKLLQPVEIKQK